MADELPVIGEAWIRGDVPEGTARQQLVWILHGPTPWNACRIIVSPDRQSIAEARDTITIALTNEHTGRYSIQKWRVEKFLAEWRRLGETGMPVDG